MGVAGHIKISEIEFPDVQIASAQVGKVALVITKSKADLDQVQTINVGFKDSIVSGG